VNGCEIAWYWDLNVEKAEDRTHPHASPLRPADLSGLPPAFIITAEFDVLRDGAEAYARQLQAAGVTAKLHRYEGMIHGFIRRYPFFDQGRAAIEEVGRELLCCAGDHRP
jgi:acetyl esterase